MIYSLIEEVESISFDEIKAKYLQKAQQLLSMNIPKNEIQDDALKRILLDLQAENVVVRLGNSNYRIQIKIPMEAWAMRVLEEQELERKVKPAILRMVEEKDNKLTDEKIARKLHEANIKVDFSFVDKMLYELRGHATLVKNKDNTYKFIPPYEEREGNKNDV